MKGELRSLSRSESKDGEWFYTQGQVLMAMWMLETSRLIWYLPALILSGLGGGILVGLCGALLVKRVP